MTATHEDANLILKLYELRREETMRKARNWFGRDFQPQSAQQIADVFKGEHSAYLRMFTSYWDMAAALVLHGPLDCELFNATNSEHIFMFTKIEPFLTELRKLQNSPTMLANVEEVIKRLPASDGRVKRMREMHAQARAAAAQAR